MVKDIISLVRPQQWLKNVFIFLPIFFSRKLGDGACLSSALIAFVIYCLVAGSIYCLNDISVRGIDCIKFANVLHILQSKGTIK